ncbi:oxidoreductase [Mycena rebaudengoi]|nr:oxidoreductase [Mycena rebaudengoi]
MKVKSYNPAIAIPDLSGRVIFVTGGTAGIGKETILALAAHNPQRIYFSGRDSKRAEAIIAEGNNAASLVFLQCDLTSLASVEQAAKQIVSESDRLDTVICNAGVMNVPPALTKDGYEVHFGTNHVGHALLIKILLPVLLRTAEMPGSDVRIVSLTSQGFATHPSGGIVFKDLRTTQDTMLARPSRYGQSKLANILYAAELARRYPQITSVSVHPGVVSTDLVLSQSAFMRALIHITNPSGLLTPPEGARNQLWASTADKSGITNGEYYEPVGELGKHARKSKDTKLAAELWEWTEKELAGYQV